MKHTGSLGKLRLNMTWHAHKIAFALAIAFALTLLTTEPMQAQFSVIHQFTGGSDGGGPYAGVTIGSSGTLYGTTTYGNGSNGSGVVFELKKRGSSWTLSPLYEFTGGADGGHPYAGVVIGPNGALYGTTSMGGSAAEGTVFELRPPAIACRTTICYWNEIVLHSFSFDNNDGVVPAYGSLLFDHAGNIYGTTAAGGASSCGVLWELAQSGGGWSESVLYSFTGRADGCTPYSGVIFDGAGNLYGTTVNDGNNGYGTGYQLAFSNGAWVEHTLVEFSSSTGNYAYGTLAIDQSGNIYGTANTLGPNHGGTVYELSPSNGGWNFSLVYAFAGCDPTAGVTLGPDGNLYGVCSVGGAFNHGWAFEVPPNCNQLCTPNDLHDFDGSDGDDPTGTVVFDGNGNLYGTTRDGGNSNNGVVWEIAGVGARHE